MLDVKKETVRKVLYGVEVAVINSTDDLEEQLQSPATVINALRDELQHNSQIVGFFACFEPDYYPSQGRSFQPYAFWRDGRIDTMQIAKTGNDYLEDDWYGRDVATDSGYWSEPWLHRQLNCNAGHKVPLVNGRPLSVERNLPIGAMPDWEFKAQETDLAPGSTIFLYTDGLDEAEDAQRQMQYV